MKTMKPKTIKYPIIIAEVGSNWKSLDDLLGSIDLAKEAGADVVKFQYFTSQELYGYEVSSVDRYSIPLGDLKLLKSRCEKVGIEFMCTAFSLQGYTDINPLVTTHKIASSESTWMDLIKHVDTLGKPILMSGQPSMAEIRESQKHLTQTVVPMFCDPNYPSSVGLATIEKAIERMTIWAPDVGLSDHSTNVFLKPTIIQNLYIIEKHYNPHGYRDTPDSPHALDHKDFREFVEYTKAVTSIYRHNPHRRNSDGFRPHYE